MAEDSTSRKLLYPVNLFLCYFVLGVLVVAFWRGTWNIPALYIFPDSPERSAGVALAVGCVINACAVLLSGVMTRKVTSLPTCLFVLTSRVYTLVLSVGLVWQWSGMWNLLDVYTGVNLTSSVASFLGGSFLLSVLRSFRSLLMCPVGVTSDLNPSKYFAVQTVLRKKPGCNFIYVVDVFVTVVIMMSLLCGTWRGLWGILDVLLFPSDLPLTAITSLVCSFLVGVVLVLLQRPAAALSARLEGKHVVLKVLWENFFLLFFFAFDLGYWRGVWYGMNMVLLPNDLVKSSWISLAGGYGLLTLIGASLNLGKIYIHRDGEFSRGKGVKFDVSYLEAIMAACRKCCRKEKYALPVEPSAHPCSAIAEVTTSFT